MIQLNEQDIQQTGGLLSALSRKCVDYLRNLLQEIKDSPELIRIGNILRRHIVHTDPHLDEFFAELLFRTCLPSTIESVEFREESLYSDTNDLGAKSLWPESVVFGIGSTVSYDFTPLFLFDEHKKDKGRTSSSCSEMVAKFIQNTFNTNLPSSLQTVLREVNTIDKFGNAHPQHLGNIIKKLNEVQFLFSKGVKQEDDVRDFLDSNWKRVIIDACITAVIFAIENNIDLLGGPDEKKNILQKYLEQYKNNSLHKDHPYFNEANQRISSIYGNQNGVFNEALLKDDNENNLKDSSGNDIPQLLLLSRICYACHHTWGEDLTNMIMAHFWETEFQYQIKFLLSIKALESINKRSLKTLDVNIRTSVGVIKRRILGKITIDLEIFDKFTNQNKTIQKEVPVWILNISSSFSTAKKSAALNFINNENYGCGIVFLEDTSLGTKSLFRAKSLPLCKWTKLVKNIMSIEPQCWHDPSDDPNKVGNCILNGNRAHLYVTRSSLDFDTLVDLVMQFFYD